MIKVLVIKPSSLGDIIHAADAVRSIASGSEDLELTWIVNAEYADFVREFPGVDNVIVFPRGRFKLRGFPFWVPEAFSWFRKLRGYDVAVDFQGLQRSALMARLSGARERFGPASARELGTLHYNRAVKFPDDMPHAIDRLDFLAKRVLQESSFLRAPPREVERSVRLPVPSWAVEASKRELAGSIEWLAMCPGTRWDSKLWPPEHWAALIRLLARELPEVRVALLGAPSEREAIEDIRERAGTAGANSINFAGNVDLWTTAAILSSARCVLALDSAPLHLAAAVGTPTVSLFGPTDPLRVAPRDPDRNIILRNEELDCLKCYERHCPLEERICLPGISPEQVLPSVLRWMCGGAI